VKKECREETRGEEASEDRKRTRAGQGSSARTWRLGVADGERAVVWDVLVVVKMRQVYTRPAASRSTKEVAKQN
jgi:hypothetical protein